MNSSTPIRVFLTQAQVKILRVLESGQSFTGRQIIDLGEISKAAFYINIFKLVSSGIVEKRLMGKTKVYTINRIGFSLVEIIKVLSQPDDLSIYELEKTRNKLVEIIQTIDKIQKIMREIDSLNKKESLSMFEQLKLLKLKHRIDKILYEVDIYTR